MARKLLLFHFLSFCCLLSANATGQIPDLIIIGKDTLMLLECPIEHDSILSRRVSERLSREGGCTACWRNYQALWQIEDDKLILKKIEDSKSIFADPDTIPEVTIDLNGIFDKYRDKKDRVTATWFSGELKVVSGKQIYYVHMGFIREHEYETVYQVKQGKIISQASYRNSLKRGIPIKDALNFVCTQFNGDRFPELVDTKVVATVTILPKPDGSIDSMEIHVHRPDSVTEERKKLYAEQISMALHKIPRWDVLTVRNKIRKTNPWTLSLWKGKGCKALYQEKQVMDTLLYNDTVYALRGFPLQYDMNLYEKVKPYLKEEWRNDCHRGYTGQWKIENGKLYLINLFHGTSTSPLPLDSIFGISGKQPIEASWFSGELHLVRGGRLIDSYEFRDVFKKEIFCEVKEGTVIRQKTYNNSFTLGDREALKQCQEELRKKEVWSRLPELKGKSVHCSYQISLRPDGTTDSIDCTVYVNGCDWHQGLKRYHKEITNQEHLYIRIFKKALQAVPKWNVLYIRDKIKKYEDWIDGKRCDD